MVLLWLSNEFISGKFLGIFYNVHSKIISSFEFVTYILMQLLVIYGNETRSMFEFQKHSVFLHLQCVKDCLR